MIDPSPAYRVEDHADGTRRVVLWPDGTSVWGDAPLPVGNAVNSVLLDGAVIAVRDSAGREDVLRPAAKVSLRNGPQSFPPTQAERLCAEIVRLRAGEDLTPREEGAHSTPGQLLARLNAATPEKRLALAAALLDSAETAHHCLMAHTELRAEVGWLNDTVEELRAENLAMRGVISRHCPPRLAIDGRAYRRRTRARTRSRR